jgi:hypothetical protein
MFIFTVDMGSKLEDCLSKRISRTLALLPLTLTNHHGSQEQEQPTAAQPSEGVAEPQLQPVAQELQPVEEVPQGQLLQENVRQTSGEGKDTGSGDKETEQKRGVPEDVGRSEVSKEEFPTTEDTGEDVLLALTRIIERVAEERRKHKTKRVLPEPEEGTSSHLVRVH